MNDLGAILQAGLAGSYTIERELGRGGMAAVFLARDQKHDRLVALKVLDPDLAASIGAERFLREIRVAARLRHPHILTVHDSGEVAGRGGGPALLWYTMPYVEGESLRERLDREGQLPITDAVAIAREAADALGHAHEHGIIHRDIKPENLLLAGRHTMVADFGIARALGDEAQRLTGTGLAVGTPAYMSPEQATGDTAVDARTDVYALGCVLYEMLAGEPPWTGPTPMQVVTRAMTEPYRPLHSVRSSVPPALERAVATSLARVPADRFANAAQMSRALDTAVMTPTHLSAASAGPALEHRRVAPRRGWILPLSVTVVLAVLAYVFFFRGGEGTAGSDDVIAVAPFELVSTDPELAVWSEGMVDVVARYFDGAGTLKAVAPTRAIRAWDGRADRESAIRFGSAVDARYVVYGQLVGGEDSVRLTASLLDVADATEMDTHEWRGVATRVDRLADSLATRFLDVLGRTRQLGMPRRDPIGTSDPLAIRAFLSGMRDLRRAAYDSAVGHFADAIARDTGFVLGRMYASQAQGWRSDAADTMALRLRLEAGARNHGLTQRDSLVVLSDSLSAALTERFRAGKGPDFSRAFRLRDVMDTLLTRYADDPDVVYRVTDENFHLNLLGRSQRWHLEGFKRAAALDPQSALAFEHAVDLSPMFDPPDTTQALIRRMLEVPGLPPTRQGALRLLNYLMDPMVAARQKQTALDTIAREVIQLARRYTAASSDTIGLMVARTYARRFPEATFAPDLVVQQLMYRGRLSEATAGLGTIRAAGVKRFTVRELASFGALPVAVFDSLNDLTWQQPLPLAPRLGVPLWVATGDTARLGRLHRRMLASRAEALPESRKELDLIAAYIHAMQRLAIGDSSAARAVAGLDRAPVGLQAETPFGILPAELSLAMLPEEHSWALLQSRQSALPEPVAVLWMLYRARLAEKRGERAIAIDNYAFVARLWQDAEEPLAGYAREARQALARLNAEPRQW